MVCLIDHRTERRTAHTWHYQCVESNRQLRHITIDLFDSVRHSEQPSSSHSISESKCITFATCRNVSAVPNLSVAFWRCERKHSEQFELYSNPIDRSMQVCACGICVWPRQCSHVSACVDECRTVAYSVHEYPPCLAADLCELNQLDEQTDIVFKPAGIIEFHRFLF